MIETWAPVEGYEGLYEISAFGRVKRLGHPRDKRTRPQSIMKLSPSDGYLITCFISREGKKRMVKAHRLVAKAFIPNPDNKPFINHKNLNRADNAVDNLEWVSHQENVNHAMNNRSWRWGGSRKDAKLTDAQVLQIKEHLKFGRKILTYKEIAFFYGVSPSLIGMIRHETRRVWQFKKDHPLHGSIAA